MAALDRRLTLEHLRCFVAVVDSGGFQSACKHLHRSQTTVTHQIKKLEEIVGNRLLHRTQGHIGNLTAIGLRFLPTARMAIAATEKAYFAASSDALHGHIRLGILEDFNATYLPEMLALFNRLHPNVTIETVSEQSLKLEEAIQNNKIDIAILKQTYDAAGNNEELPLRIERLHWVKKPTLQIVPELPLPLVVFHEGCIYRRHMTEALSTVNRSWRITYSTYSYGNIFAALEAGLGVSALPEWAIHEGLQVLENDANFPILPKIGLVIRLSEEPHYIETAKAIKIHLAQAFATIGTQASAEKH